MNCKDLVGLTGQKKGEGYTMTKEDVKLDEVVDVEVDEVIAEKSDKADEKTPKTFSEEEVEKMIQSQTDKRVSEAVKTREENLREKWEAEYEAKLEAEKSEAEKLASMSAEERAQAEFQAERDAWLEDKKVFERERMQLEATKLLGAEGLPINFVDYVVGDTAEEVSKNIETFKTEWKKALEKEVSERFKGKTPAGSSLQSKDISSMSKEEFGKLPYRERERMLKVDPDIISKLKD